MSILRIPVTETDHASGPAEAPVTVVEYGDFQCPYCAEAFPVLRQMRASAGDRVRFVFRHFPLTDVHPEALNAAFVAEFAAAHGKFWQAHDLLFENQERLGGQLYAQICETLGLDPGELQRAADEDRYTARVEADEEGGLRSGVGGTPTFFVNGLRVDAGIAGLADAIEIADERAEGGLRS